MIPPIDPSTRNLPPGVHEATLAEIEERYGYTERRRAMLLGLREAAEALRLAGCRRLYLDGSFVSAKAAPNDYDVCWEIDGVDLFQLMGTAEELLEFRRARRAPRQRERFGGEFFSLAPEGPIGREILALFQRDQYSGQPKGILAVSLGEPR